MATIAMIGRVFCFALSLAHVASAHPSQRPRQGCSCSDLKLPNLQGVSILSFTAVETPAFVVSTTVPFLLEDAHVPAICNVSIALTHPGVNDRVNIQIWLPLSNWNTRFVALGGGGYAAGYGPLSLGPAAAGGFAAASTDAGVGFNPQSPAAWALKDNGEVNFGLLTNFASRSVYEMTILGKAVTENFYGKKPTSYWNGCSTGGRQGLVAAQQYPELFDGILAGAPAIYWPTYVVSELWPQIVMKEAGLYPSPEELNAVVAAAVESCDELDGVKDGVIAEPQKCNFDPRSAIGKANTSGKEVEITPAIADIVKKIWEGPIVDGQKFWYGLPVGSPLNDLANTTVAENGMRTGNPFFVPSAWVKYFLKQDPGFDISSVGSKELKDILIESQKYDDLVNNANPDLSTLQHLDVKLLVWQGLSDQLIPTEGTTQYLRRVEDAMGGQTEVDKFFRLFLAPGVDHCAGGETFGAQPNNTFEALIAWVEKGVAPTYLNGVTPQNALLQFRRKICKYPLVAKYQGQGDLSSSDSYTCV